MYLAHTQFLLVKHAGWQFSRCIPFLLETFLFFSFQFRVDLLWFLCSCESLKNTLICDTWLKIYLLCKLDCCFLTLPIVKIDWCLLDMIRTIFLVHGICIFNINYCAVIIESVFSFRWAYLWFHVDVLASGILFYLFLALSEILNVVWML